MDARTWGKIIGLGALGLGVAGVAAVAMRDDEDEGTIPPDEIEGEDDLDDEDDVIPVESETVPDVFKK